MIESRAVEALLALAGVPVTEDHFSRVERELEIAKSLYGAAGHRGHAEDHNAHLVKIEELAGELKAELLKLRNRPVAHQEFWLAFGYPVLMAQRIEDFEDSEYLERLTEIQSAATAAQMRPKKGTPKKVRERRVIRRALKLYESLTGDKPTTYGGHPSHRFTEDFFPLATGCSVEAGELESLIQTVLGENRANNLD